MLSWEVAERESTHRCLRGFPQWKKGITMSVPDAVEVCLLFQLAKNHCGGRGSHAVTDSRADRAPIWIGDAVMLQTLDCGECDLACVFAYRRWANWETCRRCTMEHAVLYRLSMSGATFED